MTARRQPWFGSAGNPDAFYEAGGKASAAMPAWLAAQGLNAYEYQCSRGASVKEETARKIGEAAKEHQVALSVHAPYYISLAAEDETVVHNTREHFRKSLRVAHWLGADRVVFHIGGAGKKERVAALERAQKAMMRVLQQCSEEGLLEGVWLCPETMGKKNQLGTLAEVLEFCLLAPQWLRPAVDFGHLHAVAGGAFNSREEYEAVFAAVKNALGAEAAKQLHIHFSKIEFTGAGEKRHWTFADSFGPPHEPLLECCVRGGYTPRIICESAGTQALDARQMRDEYRRLTNGS